MVNGRNDHAIAKVVCCASDADAHLWRVRAGAAESGSAGGRIYSRAGEGEIAGLATVTGKLNLRAEPSASGAVLTTIPGGTDVVVVEWSDAWSVVIYTAQVNANCVSIWVGCVMSQYLDMYQVGGEIPDDPDVGGDTGWLEGVGTATVTGKLNLRAAPSTSAAVLLQIPAGMEVTVAEQSGDCPGWSMSISPTITASTSGPAM